MRLRRNDQFATSIRPGRFARPRFQPAPTPERLTLLADMSNELHRLRCLAIELQRALQQVGASELADDIRDKYFPGRHL